MKAIMLDATAKTPRVHFNAEMGLVEIKGRSIPEDAIGFYTPLYQWLNEYASMKPFRTTALFNFEYFNSSSSKCILEVLKKLEIISQQGGSVDITWQYCKDDDEILTAGEEYKALIKLPFKFVAV